MAQPKLSKLELQILEALWAHGKASIREIQEAFPKPRPAYTTIQTTVYRLEGKRAVRRVRKISNAHIFEPMVARDVTRHRLLDEILSFFGGRAQPMMAQLAEAGKLTLDDIRELEKTIRKSEKTRKSISFAQKAALAVVGTASLAAPMMVGILDAPPIQAQSPAGPSRKFEVASIKLSKSDDAGPSVRITPGRINVVDLSLRRLIFVAYKVRDFQISDGPAWINSEKYDIEAKTDGGSGADAMLLMLQALLEDRFELRLHRETRERPVYELTIARNGSKLHEATCAPFDPNHLTKQAALSEQERRAQCSGIKRGAGELDGNGMSLEDGTGPAFQSLAGQLSLVLDRPVVNRTGLTGRFDIHLQWTPDKVTNGPPNEPNNPNASSGSADQFGPSIFTAVEEQLGLKLRPAKGPVEFLVIDHMERPSAN